VARLALDNLTKNFRRPGGDPVRALAGVSLTVDNAQLVAVVGPSGCGKTTLLRLIAGLERPDSGSISIDGILLHGLAPKDRDVAMVFQTPALYPEMSAFENLAFGLHIRDVPKAEAKRRVAEAAAWLGLSECLDRMPAELSGGERQRVALGRALVRKPRLLLLDEPLSQLDAPAREQLRGEIAALQRRLGITMLYVTHDQAEAMVLGQRIAVMNQGSLQQVGTPAELYREPASLFVAGFLGLPRMNFFQGKLEIRAGVPWFDAHLPEAGQTPLAFPLQPCDPRKLESYLSKPITLGLRPENISPRGPGAGAAPETGVVALVHSLQMTGADTYAHLSVSGHSFVARLPADCGWREGEQQRVWLDGSRARLFDPATGKAILCAC